MRVNHIRVLFNNIKSLINHKLTYYSTTFTKVLKFLSAYRFHSKY